MITKRELRALTAVKLPNGILSSDTEYPRYSAKPSEAEYNAKRVVDTIELYHTPRFGWVVCVLHIRNASRRQVARGVDTARFYGYSLDKQLCTVGLGPHVDAQATVYVRAERRDALKFLIELRDEGAAKAGGVRDRISSRRTATIARRAFDDWRF